MASMSTVVSFTWKAISTRLRKPIGTQTLENPVSLLASIRQYGKAIAGLDDGCDVAHRDSYRVLLRDVLTEFSEMGVGFI